MESEVLHFCDGVPKILVALKADLRDDENVIREMKKLNQAPISTEEVENFVYAHQPQKFIFPLGSSSCGENRRGQVFGVLREVKDWR